MIASLLDYARCFSQALGDPAQRALLRAHRERPVVVAGDRTAALRLAVQWLFRAQDRPGDGGFASYHLRTGWSTSYPETSGYIIPSLLVVADHLAWPEARERALRAAEWLLCIELPDGGWQGGRIGEDRPFVVFNTAQVIRGLLATYHLTQDQRHLDACVRAGDRILVSQSRDGAWRNNNHLTAARVYDSYVSAPLLALHRATGDDRYQRAAMLNLEWVLAQQWANGWFNNCDNTRKHNDRPITHTIGYTIDGLIECSAHVRHDVLIGRAARAADALLERFLADGWLHGRYEERWNGSEHLITTGCAQLAITWGWLHRILGEERYQQGMDRMLDLLIAIQQRGLAGPADTHGALPGSYPIWGRYEKFAFPNWGVKFFVDALLCAAGRSPAQ